MKDVFLEEQGAVKATPRRATTVWWVLSAPVVVVGMGVSRLNKKERYGLFAHLVLSIFFLTQLMVKQVIRGNAG
ncbi:hypothetical protein BGW80DRAFT_1336872, partial [Lactifluus volemus]